MPLGAKQIFREVWIAIPPMIRSSWISSCFQIEQATKSIFMDMEQSFVSGSKSDDPTSPAYVSSTVSYVQPPMKRAAEKSLVRYSRVKECLTPSSE